MSLESSFLLTRPVVYDFISPAAFLTALIRYYQQENPSFSIRAQIRNSAGCSPSYISLLVKGKRRLRRDYLPIVAQIFQLQKGEVEYFDSLITPSVQTHQVSSRLQKSERFPRNHLLADWVNVYVKDCIHLNKFIPKAEIIYRLLGGLTTVQRIDKAISFLYREGFWRSTLQGQTIPDDSVVVTTSGLPVSKIRLFHKAALEIAKKGLDRIPPSRRKAYTTVVSVNRKDFDELCALVDKFHCQLKEFIDEHPTGRDQLCQVTIHLTPIGGKHDSTI